MKSKRQAKIMEIISTTNVETQEQLLQELQEAGFTTEVSASICTPKYISVRCFILN